MSRSRSKSCRRWFGHLLLHACGPTRRVRIYRWLLDPIQRDLLVPKRGGEADERAELTVRFAICCLIGAVLGKGAVYTLLLPPASQSACPYLFSSRIGLVDEHAAPFVLRDPESRAEVARGFSPLNEMRCEACHVVCAIRSSRPDSSSGTIHN